MAAPKRRKRTWLTRKEAAAHLESLGYPVAPRTLAHLATKKQGPPYQRFMHRTTMYKPEELKAWAEKQLRPGGGPAV